MAIWAKHPFQVAVVKAVARVTVEGLIRGTIFVVPVAFVAQWCGVPPTWNTIAFVAFCLFWSDCVDGRKKDATGPDSSSAVKHRNTATVLTPAEVAAEARKLTQGARPNPDR
jgi:hypothetical protein